MIRAAIATRFCAMVLMCLVAVATASSGKNSSAAAGDAVIGVGDAAMQLGSTSSWEAFSGSYLMIIASEIGDKTFFIAALLATRHRRSHVFLGAILALAAMTVLSVGIGVALPMVLSRHYTHWVATALFAYFGQKLLREALDMLRTGGGVGPSGELEEVEQELKDAKKTSSSVVFQALTLSFLAEWGDRSQISTIALAAAKEPFGVMLGGIVGHSCCSGLAVLGGHMLAARISERAICAAGGICFIVFAIHGLATGAA